MPVFRHLFLIPTIAVACGLSACGTPTTHWESSATSTVGLSFEPIVAPQFSGCENHPGLCTALANAFPHSQGNLVVGTWSERCSDPLGRERRYRIEILGRVAIAEEPYRGSIDLHLNLDARQRGAVGTCWGKAVLDENDVAQRLVEHIRETASQLHGSTATAVFSGTPLCVRNDETVYCAFERTESSPSGDGKLAPLREVSSLRGQSRVVSQSGVVCGMVPSGLLCTDATLSRAGRSFDLRFPEPKDISANSNQICVLQPSRVRCFDSREIARIAREGLAEAPTYSRDIEVSADATHLALQNERNLCVASDLGVVDCYEGSRRSRHVDLEWPTQSLHVQAEGSVCVLGANGLRCSTREEIREANDVRALLLHPMSTCYLREHWRCEPGPFRGGPFFGSIFESEEPPQPILNVLAEPNALGVDGSGEFFVLEQHGIVRYLAGQTYGRGEWVRLKQNETSR